MTSVTLDEIVFDDSIYPRTAWSQATVDRYADALQADEVFPPIILEAGTKRLLDGMHRTEAHRAVGRHFIAVDFHEIPDGVPAKLYAASLSSRHGDPLDAEDKRQVARETATSNPDFSMVLIAKLLGTTRQTVSRYVGDLVEHRREVRRAQAALLDRAGWSHRQIGEHLGVDHKTVGSDVTSNISPQSEELLREAAADLPIDAVPLVAEILAERATPPTPGPVDADGAPPADPGATPDPVVDDPRDRTHGAEFESYDAAEPPTCLGSDMDCGRPLPCPDHPAAGSGPTSPAPEPEWLGRLGEDYKTDPAERIADVAEVAPEYVKPVTERFQYTCFGCGKPFVAAEGANVCPRCGGCGTNCKPLTPEPMAPSREVQVEVGRRSAETVVETVRAEVLAIVAAVDLGEDLITEQLIADLQAAVDLLASRKKASA